MFRAEVFVTLKPVVNDPEGITILSGLHALGFSAVQEVRSGKYLVLTLAVDDPAQAQTMVEDMARRLLANAVIEDFRVELRRLEPAAPASAGDRA